ncbi:MAG: hypothetical protein ACPGWR_26310 [Ardenticatenaceae bacterium]
MKTAAPLIIVYLLGTATPVLFFRYFVGRLSPRGDDGGCILDFLLVGIVMLVGLTLFAWMEQTL